MMEAMKEKGIDISLNKPKLVTFQMVQDADLIGTLVATTREFATNLFLSPQLIGSLTQKANPTKK